MSRDLPPTINTNEAKSDNQGFMAKLSKSAGAATKLVALQAERTKLNTLTLPAAYRALGKDCLQQKRHLECVPELVSQLRSVLDEIKQLSEIATTKDAPKSFTDKAKAAGKQVLDVARTKQLGMKRDSIIGGIGKAIYDQQSEKSGAVELVSPIQRTITRIAELDAEIDHQSQAGKGSLLTPKMMLIGVGAIGLLFVAILFRGIVGTGAQDQMSQINTNNIQGVDESPTDSNGSGPTTSAPALLSKSSFELPPEIANQKKWPDFPLGQMPIRLAQEQKGYGTVPQMFFSTLGSRVLLFYDDGKKQDVKIWNVKTGEEHQAKSPDCNYFSFPAAFSPDDTSVACVDGDFLRIWSLKTSTATLIESINIATPTTGYSKEIGWNGIQWSTNDVLVLRSIAQDQRNRSYQAYRRTSGRFEPFGSIQKNSTEYKGKRTWFNSVAVSPDGKLAAVAVEPELGSTEHKHLVVQIRSCDSGKEIHEIVLPQSSHAIHHFPTNVFADRNKDQGPWVDPGSCLEFSPDGQRLLIASQGDDKEQSITVLKTGSWDKVASLDCNDLQPSEGNRSAFKLQLRLCSFSSDGNRLVGIATKTTRTSRGETVNRVAVVFDLDSGKRLSSIDLGDQFVLDERISRVERSTHEAATFTADGKAIVVAVMGAQKQEGTSWTVGSWDLSSGSMRFAVSKTFTGLPGNFGVVLSPDGNILATSSGPSAERQGFGFNVWEVPHLVKLKSDVSEGDKLWATGDHSKAFEFYCAVLADNMAWFVDGDIRRIYSRCVDTFAERGEVQKGRSLIVQTQQRKISLAPETPDGKKLLNEFQSEQAEARRLKSQQRNEVLAKALAEKRTKNKQQFVPAGDLTKEKLIDKLKSVMARGRIDNLVTYAIFEDYSFEDVLGPPDSNLEWVDTQRLVSYRCSDGIVQLTVTYLEGTTVLHGINQY